MQQKIHLIRHGHHPDGFRGGWSDADLTDALGINDVTHDPWWREVNNGLLAGMANVDAAQRYPGLYWSALGPDEPYPGGGDSPELTSSDLPQG
jgi:probable phosphoglycerate mutase